MAVCLAFSCSNSLANALAHLAVYTETEEDFERALSVYNSVLLKAVAHNDETLATDIKINIASTTAILSVMGSNNGKISRLEAAITLFKDVLAAPLNPRKRGRVLVKLGGVLAELGTELKQLNLLHEALAAYQQAQSTVTNIEEDIMQIEEEIKKFDN